MIVLIGFNRVLADFAAYCQSHFSAGIATTGAGYREAWHAVLAYHIGRIFVKVAAAAVFGAFVTLISFLDQGVVLGDVHLQVALHAHQTPDGTAAVITPLWTITAHS